MYTSEREILVQYQVLAAEAQKQTKIMQDLLGVQERRLALEELRWQTDNGLVTFHRYNYLTYTLKKLPIIFLGLRD